jgi:tRNA (cytidine/uridine-2'-O-)-methyltransferase
MAQPLPDITPPFNIVLHEPDIPPNTGNIARLCAGTGAILHLIEPLGFRLTSQAMRRAGLDYWEAVAVHRHANIEAFFDTVEPPRFFLLSTKGERSYLEPDYQPGDTFIFGSETRGLPEALLQQYTQHVVTIPMRCEAVRSMNLSNAVAVVLYEAISRLL